MTRLILATRNAGKITELRPILADAGLPHDLVGADAYPDIPDVKETGVTFAENALLKAHALARATGLPAVADDSGLCVDVLGGAPGIFSARWSGTPRRRQRQPGPAPGPARPTSPTNTAAPTSPARRPWPCPDGTERVVEGRCGAPCATPRRAPAASATTRSSSRRARRVPARN